MNDHRRHSMWPLKTRSGIALVAILAALWASQSHAEVGANWKLVRAEAEWPARFAHGSVVHGGKMWVMGGAFDTNANSLNDVWSSSDGIAWTQVTSAANWPARNLFKALSFGGKLWVLGGLQSSGGSTIFSDAWSSSTGQTWQLANGAAQFGARFGHGAVVHGGAMFVFGGFNGSDLNDVWSSVDGVTWSRVTAAAGWSPRSNITAVEYNSRIWVLGGYVGGTGAELHDVWSSSDGQTWTQETPGASWGARDSFGLEVYDGRLWVMGGYPTGSDVWYSSTGSSWTQSTASAEWPARFLPTALVFNNKLWIFGGVGGTIIQKDVWYTSTNASIAGRVTASVTNAGIACAAISASSLALTNPRVTTADTNGDFRLDDIPAGSYTITVYAPGYVTKNKGVTLGDGERGIENFSMTASGLSGGVRGSVTDSVTSKPIPALRVDAKINGSIVATTYTCAEGRYEILGLVAKATSVTVQFSGDAYTTQTQAVQVSSGSVTEADAQMAKSVPAPGALAGVVTRLGTSSAVLGARVTIEGLGGVTETADAGGVYAFSALPEGTYSVRASATGYSGQTQLATVYSLGTSPLDFALPLAPKGDVNQDAAVNATDVQLVINAALGIPAQYNCDVSKDGQINAVDVQQVINAALGL
ncbi:MAG: carboxypeptidase regulatory-like domain-containing protein [Candidatus Hydrogenedentes bacterium]|nr:carboxypeptidase regulatory-like domain-containing protein [Candidatus Hydrogenedentota bacterium]